MANVNKFEVAKERAEILGRWYTELQSTLESACYDYVRNEETGDWDRVEISDAELPSFKLAQRQACTQLMAELEKML